MTLTISTELEPLTCCECALVFAVPTQFETARRRDHAWFYCPRGHVQHFAGESEAEKLRRERDRLKQKLAEKDDDIAAAIAARDNAMTGWREANGQALTERRRANGYKGFAAKIGQRAKAGVCPCCNRTFGELARHMASEHPQFTPTVADPDDVAQDVRA